MQKFTKHILLLILTILVAPFAGINLLAAQTNISTSDRAIASAINSTGETKVQSLAENSLAQVTSVSQLSDVQPTDWAFQALQSLVERYGCIEGYPDKTFKVNCSMTPGVIAIFNRKVIAATQYPKLV